MSLIDIQNLSFSYESSFEPIFESVSFQIDTDWRLGLIGRNGRGKTTFLRLLQGKYPYSGTITAAAAFEYFPFEAPAEKKNTLQTVKDMIAPYSIWEQRMEQALNSKGENALREYGEVLETYLAHDGYEMEDWIRVESAKLKVTPDTLERSWNSLSGGEQVKLMLAALFLKKNRFLLIDEPTNHLDQQGRQVVANYLSGKKGFILVSHDRKFLDESVDHILSINRRNIEVQRGNYSSWLVNKTRQDQMEIEQNERLKKDIVRLRQAAKRAENWSDKTEKSKTGAADKGFVGHKAAKMMKRAKSIEARQNKAAEEKLGLLKNVEENPPLKMHVLPYTKKKVVEAVNLSAFIGNQPLFEPVSFTVKEGERLAVIGRNGCGKSTLLRLLAGENIRYNGNLILGKLEISYLAQDTSFLKGGLTDFCQANKLDESLFKSILRKLDFSRVQFEKSMEDYSGGQKKKVLLAASLCKPAQLFIWDEPLNYIDVLSRSQIEEVILKACPTMVFVEHDQMFLEKIATQYLFL